MSRPDVGRAPEVVELDRRAVRASMAAVERVRDADLDRPTPCSTWSLRELLAHMTAQHAGFAAAAAGRGTDPAAWVVRAADDPVSAYAGTAERVLAAFAEDGVEVRQFALPELSSTRTFPGAQAIGFHLVDFVVHAWDVSRSIGIELELDPATLAATDVIARSVPDGPSRLAPRSVFAPAVAASAADPTLDQIVAHLGRSPHWPDA